MTNASETLRGQRDPVLESQATFRTCLDAMSRPGTIRALERAVVAPPPLMPTSAALLLTLADFETSVWIDAPARDAQEVASYLKFYTGASIVEDPREATFALVTDANRMPVLQDFAQGTLEYPDRSTTVVVQVQSLNNKDRVFTGPGIAGQINFGAAPLPDGFWRQVLVNGNAFPCGVDLFFTSPTHIAALPRSARIDLGSSSCM